MGATRIGPNVTKVAIVYGKTSGQVRRHIYAEVDHSEYELPNTLLPGEAMCFVDIAHHHAGHAVFHQAIRDAVKAHGNVVAVLFTDEPGAQAHRWVTLDENNIVTHLLMADPAIDNVQFFDANGKRVGSTVTIPQPGGLAATVFTQHKTLDEMGYINVPANHPPVGIGHVHDPVTNTFNDPRIKP